MREINQYRCKHCKKVVERENNRQWIKSYCEDSDRDVHLTLVKKL